ncbi:hypothetical protein [Geminocystis herdmanii]|uniref:hypothetical protein n=1 Tax=Geminocystis herdmanii TaxID=669359 RepID=UPI000348FF0D|nr:hypothetical protein [Geminocystis herdmanii]
MSSPPPSTKPYKSRLFNFVNRNYIKFNSKVNVKIRELGYVVQGGLQSLILPFFWLWETTKKVSKSFVASPQSKISLPKGKTTKNIDNSIDNDDLILVINNAINDNPELPSLPSKNFQGLASRLKNKRLIFVLEKNKIKDIIPIKQQLEINLLINDMTEKFTSQKLLSASTKGNFLTKFFAGLNIFGKSKVESKISQDVNNLQSSDLVINSPVNHNSIIAFIDNLLVSLERLTFPNSSSIEPQNQDIIEQTQEKISILRLIREALDYFFKTKNIPLSQDNQTAENSLITNNINDNLPPAQKTIQNIITKSQETAENIIPQIQETTEQLINQGLNQLNIAKNHLNDKLNNPDDPFQIQVLIWAAINYFFSQQKSSLSANAKKSFLPSFSETEIILINDEIADPWLSWEDLYSSIPKLPDTIEPDNNESNFILPQDDISMASIEPSEIIESLSVENQEISINISSAKNTVLDIPKIENKANINNKNSHDLSNQKVTFEEEIEVKVIEIKYEKHFLEIILEKLDRLILWLEEILIKIVNKVKLMTKKIE